MALKLVSSKEIEAAGLASRRTAIVGYGNQGRAHALNMRDSGVDVTVGQRPGSRFNIAQEDGFSPLPVEEAVAGADLVVLALPDESAAEVFQASVEPTLRPGSALGFVHGFNIRFGFIRPRSDTDIVMVAPKGPGTLLRSLFLEGRGLPALVAMERDATGSARQIALGWAAAIGAGRSAVVETTFAAETETDLFGEQAVLCGGVTALCKAAFETLVEAGYEPELAYLECVHELKQIVDLIYADGLTAMRRRISNTAEYGDLTRGPRLISKEVRAAMSHILQEIRNGSFAEEWLAEHKSGGTRFRALEQADAQGAFEHAGEAVRRLMPWLAKQGDVRG